MVTFDGGLRKLKNPSKLGPPGEIQKMHTQSYKHSLNPAAKLAFAFMLIAMIALAAGCGGGGSSISNLGPTPTPPPGTTSTQVRFGDAPADSVIAFEVSVSALTLTPAGGGSAVSVTVPANNRIELTHASGKFEPFLVGNLPRRRVLNLTWSARLTFLQRRRRYASTAGHRFH